MLSSVRLLSSLKLPILVVLLPASLLLVDIFIEWLCKKCWYLHILFWPFTNPLYLSFLSSEISPSFPMLLLSIYQSMSFFFSYKMMLTCVLQESFQRLSRLILKSNISQEDTRFSWWEFCLLSLPQCCVVFGGRGEVWKCSKAMKDCLFKTYLF